MTTFGAKREGDGFNIEIDRTTQVIVDTVRDAVDEQLGLLLPALQAFARERGIPFEARTGSVGSD
jgi:riboflavin synthase